MYSKIVIFHQHNCVREKNNILILFTHKFFFMAATYLNIGIEYDNENNFYNALKAYELAMEKESAIINGLCDVAVTLKQLGLQKQALETINQCIKQFEINPRSEKDLRPIYIIAIEQIYIG